MASWKAGDSKVKQGFDMRRLLLAALLLFFVSISFVAGIWLASSRGWGSSVVIANIRNDSLQPLQSVTIHIETCGDHLDVASGKLGPGQTRRLAYAICGDGGYTVEAQFVNGRALKAGDAYVESGNVTDIRISEGQIVAAEQLR